MRHVHAPDRARRQTKGRPERDWDSRTLHRRLGPGRALPSCSAMVCVYSSTVLLLSIWVLLLCQGFAVAEMVGWPAMKRKPRPDAGQRKEKKNPPNIVFILVDDLGFNDVGYHGEGGALLRTPNIDRLALEGVRLENYYVQPSCTPTRSQLMTGRYQIHTGMQHDNLVQTSPHCLPPHEFTLAQALKAAGYSTHGVGKWHLGFCRQECLPTKRGFDSYLGVVLGQSNHFNYKKRAGSALYFNETPVKPKIQKYSTTLYTERAEEVIGYHTGSSKPPLFLYVSYQSQHTPLQVPHDYLPEHSQRIADTKRQKYAAMLSVVDEGVQNITRALQVHGLWENTLLIFSTDNGGRPRAGGINWPLRGEKSSLWEGGVRGVAFVAGPILPKSVRGTVNRELYHVSDWFPTLVRGLAGSRMTYVMPLDGVNVWRSLSQGKPSPRKELLHNIDPLHKPAKWTNTDERVWGRLDSLPFNATIRAAIRVGNWKLVTGDAGASIWTPPPESGDDVWKFVEDASLQTCIRLFNVRRDPIERVDVAASNPRVVGRLLRRLAELQASAVPAINHYATVKFPSNSTQTGKRQPAMPIPLVHVTGVWTTWMDDSTTVWRYPSL
ncbi:arylsulfatase B-like [Acanthaster planci]|uniref:Arylsulfatase B-like n=1 Tax=Acanthaster planci TaxID=133434 RepID=A0A8B7ZV07_ACAPL|nr:arylsulfatase B-like [Acanthaster planci]